MGLMKEDQNMKTIAINLIYVAVFLISIHQAIGGSLPFNGPKGEPLADERTFPPASQACRNQEKCRNECKINNYRGSCEAKVDYCFIVCISKYYNCPCNMYGTPTTTRTTTTPTPTTTI